MADVTDVKWCRIAREVYNFLRGICVVLSVTSSPIAVQGVCTSTITHVSCALAVKQAVVSRLASIAELAGMDLCVQT